MEIELDVAYLSLAESDPPDGHLWGGRPESHAEAARFFDAAFDLLREVTTDCFDWFDLKTGDYLYTEIGAPYWTGPDSIRLGRERAEFYPFIRLNSDYSTNPVGAKAVPQQPNADGGYRCDVRNRPLGMDIGS